jgi:hypothetical protein
VFLEYADAGSAHKAALALHGRTFGESTVAAALVDSCKDLTGCRALE